jgi:hypothetical protein
MIQTFDYGIDNQQICTHRPFMVNFPHDCSRTRLTEDINIPNNDQILYISFIFTTTSGMNTSIIITKSSKYNQKIYLTVFTLTGRYIFINNKTLITLNDTAVTTYLSIEIL